MKKTAVLLKWNDLPEGSKKVIQHCIEILIGICAIVFICACDDDTSSVDSNNNSSAEDLAALDNRVEHALEYCSSDEVDPARLEECGTSEHIYGTDAWDCMREQTDCEEILDCFGDNSTCTDVECPKTAVDCMDSVYLNKDTQRWDFSSAFGNCSNTSAGGKVTPSGEYLDLDVSVCIAGECLSSDEIVDTLCTP